MIQDTTIIHLKRHHLEEITEKVPKIKARDQTTKEIITND